jgi:UDP-N-acetylmuramoyl-tripeptide--D-alanyl-D-alanine ligase
MPAAERTHSGRLLLVLYPLGRKIRGVRSVPTPVKKVVRRALTRAAVRAYTARCRRVFMVGVTGSTGKTTVKDLLSEMLSAVGQTSRTHHNDNGVYGVPASLLSVRPDDRFAVIELGIMDGPGEIPWTARLFRPRVAVLTGIGSDHVTRWGSQTAIVREKRALLERVPADGAVVVNADDELALGAAVGLRCRVLTAGRSPGATVRLLRATLAWPNGLDVEASVRGRRVRGRVALHGRHLAPAVVLALAAADACGVDPDDAFEGAAAFVPRVRRFQPVPGPAGSILVLDDFESRVHTAVPAVEALREIPARRRLVVLGELQECPLDAAAYRPLGEALLRNADQVIAVGPCAQPLRRLFADAGAAGRLRSAADVEEAAERLRGALGEGDLVLVHGSPRLKLARIEGLLEVAEEEPDAVLAGARAS